MNILISTPFRNESHSLPLYLKALCNLNYPKELIDIFWLENDSSDNTLKILKEAQPKMPFRSTTLKSINILGQVKKGKAGKYVKDIPYGPGRKRSWLVIWNEHFLPLARKSSADYILFWYADAIPPPNVITEYLKVFNEYPDAGWVGGSMYLRYPKHKRLATPRPPSVEAKKPIRVSLASHCWMNPRRPLSKCTFYGGKKEMHYSLVNELYKQGLYVYYQPTVFLKHISTDGKIYTLS